MLPLLILSSLPAIAVQVTVPRPQLCANVDRVVVAQLTDLDTRPTDSGIQRRVHGAVLRTVKGDHNEGVDFVLKGGRLGDDIEWYSDSPTLVANGTYLLFLSEVDGELRVQGGEQGAVRITPEGSFKGERLADAIASVGSCRE